MGRYLAGPGLKNMGRNYPISTLPLSEVPSSMAYRTGPKGWMDKETFVQWIQEIPDEPNGIRRVIYLDNCGRHNDSPGLHEALEKKH